MGHGDNNDSGDDVDIGDDGGGIHCGDKGRGHDDGHHYMTSLLRMKVMRVMMMIMRRRVMIDMMTRRMNMHEGCKQISTKQRQ